MMKKILTFLIVAQAIFVSAQSDFGIAIGGNISYLTCDSSQIPMKYGKLSPMGGFFLNIETPNKEGMIETGLFFSQQGANFVNEEFTTNQDSLMTEKYIYEIKNDIYYIKFPLTWKQSWGDFYSKLGLYSEYAINAKSTWLKTHEFSDHIDTIKGTYKSFSNSLRPYDIGLIMAIGVQTPLTPRLDFFLNIEYNLGFLSINPDEIIDENRMFNRFFTINTGVIILNKRKFRVR